MRRLRFIPWLLLLLTSVAFAEASIERRTMGVVFRDGVAHLYYSARDLIDMAARKRLDSGLPQRIVVQHFAYVGRRAEPVAVSGHTCRVVYDLWQAAYRVEREVLGGTTKHEVLSTRAEVLELCLVMRNAPIGAAEDFRGASKIHFASLIELNPLSTSTIARIRRWLSRPRSDESVGSRSFFGSFVSLFVNDRIGTAERTLRLRSQDVGGP